MLQCVVVCCIVLQQSARDNVLHDRMQMRHRCGAEHYRVLQSGAEWCRVVQSTCDRVVQSGAEHVRQQNVSCDRMQMCTKCMQRERERKGSFAKKSPMIYQRSL